jgi:hypothetical protein
MDEFADAIDAGAKPDVEEFLDKHRRSAKTLRPVLEGLLILDAERRRRNRHNCPCRLSLATSARRDK